MSEGGFGHVRPIYSRTSEFVSVGLSMFVWIGKNERGVINRKFGTAGVSVVVIFNLSSSWLKG